MLQEFPLLNLQKARILSLAQSLDQRPQGASTLKLSGQLAAGIHLFCSRSSIPVCFQRKGVPGTVSGIPLATGTGGVEEKINRENVPKQWRQSTDRDRQRN